MSNTPYERHILGFTRHMLEMTVVACLFMRELIFLTEEQFTGEKMNSLHKTLNVTS